MAWEFLWRCSYWSSTLCNLSQLFSISLYFFDSKVLVAYVIGDRLRDLILDLDIFLTLCRIYKYHLGLFALVYQCLTCALYNTIPTWASTVVSSLVIYAQSTYCAVWIGRYRYRNRVVTLYFCVIQQIQKSGS